MNSNQNFIDIKKAFYSDGYQLGMETVESNLSKDSLFLSISKMYAAIDELIDSLTELSNKQNDPIKCKNNCANCCHQPVFTLDYEMQYLNSFIKENFSEQKQTVIKIRAHNNRIKLSRLTELEILNSKQPCPLLENESCSVYEARPMACRIYLSTNVESCEKFFNNPENKSSFPALLEFPIHAGRFMNEGFKSALKSKKISVKEFRIEERICLETGVS